MEENRLRKKLEEPAQGCPLPVKHPTRPPTAFQTLLDQHRIPRLKSWRAASS
jgi:hypothetical protein